MQTLIDTSVLFAYSFRKDVHYQQSQTLIRGLINDVRIVPAPVLSELFYLLTVRINYSYAVRLFSLVQNAFQIEPLTSDDMRRMQQIMTRYVDAQFDFTDAAIMAQAERLKITQVATFDRRDFSMFRPNHCDYLELLP